MFLYRSQCVFFSSLSSPLSARTSFRTFSFFRFSISMCVCLHILAYYFILLFHFANHSPKRSMHSGQYGILKYSRTIQKCWLFDGYYVIFFDRFLHGCTHWDISRFVFFFAQLLFSLVRFQCPFVWLFICYGILNTRTN